MYRFGAKYTQFPWLADLVRDFQCASASNVFDNLANDLLFAGEVQVVVMLQTC